MKSLKKVRKTIFKKEMKMMKKVLYVGLAVAIIAMFSIPSMLFAEEGDATTYVGLRDEEVVGVVYAGQYVMGDSDDKISDSEGDGDTEVFCIDGDTYLIKGDNQYTLTDIDVSDELVGELDKEADGVVTPVEAVAAEILSIEATGATGVEDQVAMWQETGDNAASLKNIDDEQKKHVQAINASVDALAEDYIEELISTPDLTIEDFLHDDTYGKNINELEVTVDQDDDIFTGDNGTAIAIMENPLVPGITDQNKNITWYILAGAFNISFSEKELVTEIASKDGVANKMTDHEDKDTDIDGDGKKGDSDYFGMATVPYYYFNWGMEKYPEGTMCVNIFAWVDIDGDDKLDIVDIDASKAADGNDSDGSVVADFQANHQVVQVNASGTGPELEDADRDGNVDDIVTAPIPTSDMDIHKVEGGKVVIANLDLKDAPEDKNGNYLPANQIEGGRENSYQRFSTLSYTESYDEDPQFWGTIIFKKDNSGSPLGGAVFSVYGSVDDSGNPTGDAVATFTSGDDGYADVSGLEWGTYYIVETTAPDGYVGDSTVYALTVNGTGVTVTSLGNEEGLDIPFHITNTPPPPTPPKPPTAPPATPPTTTTTVAGIIEVAGISELPFTGMNPIIPLSGISIMVIGAALLAVSLIRRKRIKKMEA
jgi:hypothetical protein